MKRLIATLIAAIFSLLGLVASSAFALIAAPVPTATTTQIIGYDAASNSFNVTFDDSLDRVGFGPIVEESLAAHVGEFSTAPAVLVATETADGAANAANGVRLGQQLARESANSAFTSSGELSSGAIGDSNLIIPGSRIGNPDVIKSLTSDGSDIFDGVSTQRGRIRVHLVISRCITT